MKDRKHYSKEQILRHLESHAVSGQTATAYCESQGLSKSTFFRWRKIHKDSLSDRQNRFVELTPITEPSEPVAEMRLIQGHTLVFYPGADAKLISQIIRKI